MLYLLAWPVRDSSRDSARNGLDLWDKNIQYSKRDLRRIKLASISLKLSSNSGSKSQRRNCNISVWTCLSRWSNTVRSFESVGKVPDFDHSDHGIVMSIDCFAEKVLRTINCIGFFIEVMYATRKQLRDPQPWLYSYTMKEPLTEAETAFQTFGTVTALLARRGWRNLWVREKVTQRKFALCK